MFVISISNKYKLWQILILLCIACHSTLPQDNIPTTSGFSGFALLAPGYFKVESNLLVTGSPLLGDVGNTQIESIFEPPASQSSAALLMGGELNYTFSSTRTQLYLGNRIEDLLRLDLLLGLGIRQELPDSSILAANLLFTPFDLKYWSDPYIEGEDRKRTGLYLPGFRLRWGRIFKTGLELTATTRWYQHDEEKSGEWLIGQGRLNSEQQPLLDRDGNVLRLQALYRFHVTRQHRFEPTVRYVIDNHNGGAIANKEITFQLTYLYLSQVLVLDANLIYGIRKFDEIHPVYNETLDLNRWGAALTTFIPIKRFEGSVLNVFVTAEIFQEDVNVDFFDSKIASINAGIVWRFIRN